MMPRPFRSTLRSDAAARVRKPAIRFFVHDPESGDTDQITARMADQHWRETDAGVTYGTFVVLAPTLAEADALAAEWVALWSNDDNGDVGDMMLLHREWKQGHTYAVLTRERWPDDICAAQAKARREAAVLAGVRS